MKRRLLLPMLLSLSLILALGACRKVTKDYGGVKEPADAPKYTVNPSRNQ